MARVCGEVQCTWVLAAAVLAAGVGSAARAGEGPCGQTAKVHALDGVAEVRFGRSVSVYGDRLLVGAEGDSENGSFAGAAYVYRNAGTGWVQEAKLLASDGDQGDGFGKVSLWGERALIGAPGDSDNGPGSGSVYVFWWDGNQWVQEANIVPSDGAEGDRFGAVSLWEDRALVGAPGDDDNGDDSGSAYVFRRVGSLWVVEAKLLASDGAAMDSFGTAVCLRDGRALIGASGDDDNGADSGSAYVFRWDGSAWVEEGKLLASDGASGARFGESVALWGETALIGAPVDGENGFAAGAAYVFRWDGTGWVEEAKLLASDGAPSDWFGTSVALWGDLALIGASGDDDRGIDSGSAYVFRWDGSDWVELGKVVPGDGAPVDFFGSAVALEGQTVVVGAYGDDDDGLGSGSAYVLSCAAMVRGDLDGDGDVDTVDVSAFAACFGGSGVPCSGTCCEADFDGDGDVDIADFSTFAANFTGSQ